MSVVEDTRKVIQDFLAPELREQKARMEAVDHQLREIKDTLKDMRAESKTDLAQLRTELKSDIAVFRQEAQVAMKDLTAETKLGFVEVRSDLRLSERVEKIEKTIRAEQREH